MNRVRNSFLATTALCLPLALAAPASAAQNETVQLNALNGSGASGTATLVLDDAANTLAVSIRTTGMVPNLPHAQHLHIGGRNVCPDASAAGDDGIINTPEGQPAYGEIQISLTTAGDFGKASALAVERMPKAGPDGLLTYERTLDLSEVDGDINLDDVVVVQHGIDTISPNGQYGPPPPTSPLMPELPLEATAPATCGAVLASQMTQTPAGGVQTGGGGTAGVENEGVLALGALSLLGAGALAVRRRQTSAAR